MTESAPSHPIEPGRIARDAMQANRTGWMRWLPGLNTLRQYESSWLRHDLVAGLVMTTMLVPVGIAYAEASGVPGSTASTRPSCRCSRTPLFGPSRILVLGPDSALAAVILTVVLPLSAGDPQRAVALAGMMAIVSGVVCIAAGLARLGFITELLSKPIRYGYMNGIALTVLLSQIPKLLGFSVTANGPLRQAWGIVDRVLAGQHERRGARDRRRHARADSGAEALAARPGHSDRRRRRDRLWSRPSTSQRVLACRCSVLCRRAALAAPSARALRRPRADSHGWRRGRARFVRRHQRAFSNLCGAFAYTGRSEPGDGGPRRRQPRRRLLSGLPHQQQLSRTPVAEAAGARTQLTGVVGALAIALLLVLAPDLLQHLPHTALAAVVIASAIGLIEVSDLRRIYRIQRWEFWLSMVCFAGVAMLGAIPGIALAIVIAVIEFLWDGWRPHSAVLGRVERVKGYHDITRYPEARLIPGLVLFRWDAPLFFANAELFHERVLDAVASSPTPVRWLVVAAEPVTSVDVTAADAVCELDDTLHAAGIELCFAEMKDPVKDKLKRFGLFTRFGEQTFFATLGEAVSVYLATHPVEWVDWEDRTSEGKM